MYPDGITNPVLPEPKTAIQALTDEQLVMEADDTFLCQKLMAMYSRKLYADTMARAAVNMYRATQNVTLHADQLWAEELRRGLVKDPKFTEEVAEDTALNADADAVLQAVNLALAPLFKQFGIKATIG